MAACAVSIPKDGVACVGIRGMQQLRRSKSTSAICSKVRSKVSATKEQLSTHSLDASMLAMKLLAGLGVDSQARVSQPKHHLKQGVAKDSNKSLAAMPKTRMQETTKPVSSPTKQLGSETRSAMSIGDAGNLNNTTSNILEATTRSGFSPDSMLSSRSYYCKDLYAFEELTCLVGGDHDKFDDECGMESSQSHKAECFRHFFSKEINSYEEFCNLVGGDHENFDDEVIEAARPSCCSRCPTYYCTEIRSYEEFYSLVGSDWNVFDDEVESWVCRKQRPTCFYCNSVQSYEELICIGGEGATLDLC